MDLETRYTAGIATPEKWRDAHTTDARQLGVEVGLDEHEMEPEKSLATENTARHVNSKPQTQGYTLSPGSLSKAS